MLVTAWRGGARSQSATVGDRPELRFSLFPPEKTNFGAVSVSPDGRQIAFTAAGDDANGLLWIRPLDATTARSIPDTEGAMFPFWSPASDALGFFAGGKLWVFDLSGGALSAGRCTNRAWRGMEPPWRDRICAASGRRIVSRGCLWRAGDAAHDCRHRA